MMPLCSVFADGKAAHASFWFYCAAILPNLVLGFGCTWIMWQSLNQLFLFFSKRSPELMNGVGLFGVCFSIFMIAAMLGWCCITGIFAYWINSTIHCWIA